MSTVALIRVFFIRAFRRTECKIAITATALCCLIAFTETCLRFYGADVGELPSAAYAWAWNMDAMQVNASRVYLFFVMPVAGAMVFSDTARCDLKSGCTCLLASRTSIARCICAYGFMSFAGAFLLTLVALALLQLLAFVAFPLSGTFEGYLGMPMYLDLRTTGGLLVGLWESQPYIYNLVFAFAAATWAGGSALLSFALGLFMRRNKAALVLPAAISLAAFVILPLIAPGSVEYLHFAAVYPEVNDQALSLARFVLTPCVCLIPALCLMCLACARGRDLLL
ncbi:MAG: hypothetical protein Q4B77_02615 [Coriobacteriaceae bacterium]|nr:hypothetical protein [Coriobacteriaceae bacterium]